MSNAAKTADAAYQSQLQQAHAMLRSLSAKLDAHANKQSRNPDNWGHVGDMQATVEALRAIAATLPSI